MELTVVKDLHYEDSFKGRVQTTGGKPFEGTFKIMVNNPGARRMSIKTKDGVILNISYDDVQNIQNVGIKGKAPKGSQKEDDKKEAVPMRREDRPDQEVPFTPEETKEEFQKRMQQKRQNALEKAEEIKKRKESEAQLEAFVADNYEEELLKLIKAGIKNIWLVGPAGCGKTTITKNVATALEVGIHTISCGLGTSASEFIGYKYPARENTAFAEYYAMPSIILLDEFTALDPAVAQISNSALANGFIMTTNGRVERHPDCIIVATSNTFGQGANRQYVANNQLDASTIDRFVGGILEMDYSFAYEKQYDPEVFEFIQQVRTVIKTNMFRRIASTRMLIEGCKLKEHKVNNWKFRLVSNWTKAELDALRQNKIENGFKKELVV
jgi:hypothetical protein